MRPIGAARSVLVSHDLVVCVVAFQGGVYEDMLVFTKLPMDTCEKALKAAQMGAQRHPGTTIRARGFEAMDVALSRWYALHGAYRLEPLLTCLPSMRDVVSVHATAHGDLHVLQRVLELHGFSPHLLHLAVATNVLPVVAFVSTANTPGFTFRTLDLAASLGHLDIVQWLHGHRADGASNKAMDRAARFGHLSVVQWLHEHREEGCTTDAMDCAARNGHLSVLVWLHAHRQEGWTVSAMEMAASRGNLPVVEWLHAHKPERDHDAMLLHASSFGHFVVVRFLCENGYDGLAESIAHAREQGHHAMLAFLIALDV
ncbi:Aste57867_11367 [Aphanomyces stellatus]|uniref:Aste57867_11367 protein n=1 Tax=Aphanomyces stellatus TaxID=120398 RepID=A0A485KTB2_9STRA|nr:hypothetical protein As57867_011325 [Aphanomyces stellatus]VFT88229.1 Aste57867_11367 [Aphanomyces stellatus]